MDSPNPSLARIPDGCQTVNVEALRRQLKLRSWTFVDLSKATAGDGKPPVDRDTIARVMRRGIANCHTMLRIQHALVSHPPSDVAEELVG